MFVFLLLTLWAIPNGYQVYSSEIITQQSLLVGLWSPSEMPDTKNGLITYKARALATLSSLQLPVCNLNEIISPPPPTPIETL